ncbi:hypothetical protein HAX54_044291 [Datura stramonium]|uniref:Uncharacterized protein n=1 Tax=Datura stramonium TaxID=4076 RepID=A0ABS8W2E5_DATST|nr:hypothetical protein [Datura stramonium]
MSEIIFLRLRPHISIIQQDCMWSSGIQIEAPGVIGRICLQDWVVSGREGVGDPASNIGIFPPSSIILISDESDKDFEEASVKPKASSIHPIVIDEANRLFMESDVAKQLDLMHRQPFIALTLWKPTLGETPIDTSASISIEDAPSLPRTYEESIMTPRDHLLNNLFDTYPTPIWHTYRKLFINLVLLEETRLLSKLVDDESGKDFEEASVKPKASSIHPIVTDEANRLFMESDIAKQLNLMHRLPFIALTLWKPTLGETPIDTSSSISIKDAPYFPHTSEESIMTPRDHLLNNLVDTYPTPIWHTCRKLFINLVLLEETRLLSKHVGWPTI